MDRPKTLHIVHHPHPALYQKSDPISEITEDVRDAARQMLKLMHEADGVGLAANQVALTWRLFVTRALDEDDEDRVFVNPTLTITDKTMEAEEEGCLSFPGINGDVRRPNGIRIEATDLNGEQFTLEDVGFRARVWQHEFDHIDGITFNQRFSMIDRMSTKKAIRNLEKYPS